MLITILKKGVTKKGANWYLVDIQTEFLCYHILCNSELDLEESKKYENLRLSISTYKGQVRYELIKD